MNKCAMLALLVLSSCVFPVQTPLQKFVNDTFEPDQSVETGALYFSGGNFVLVSADNAETYVVDTASGKALYDAAQIEAILVSDLKDKRGFEAKRNSSISLAREANLAKNLTEAQCMLLTGTAMHECFDRDSCIFACKSNPNCDILLYSDGFWEAILGWSKSRKGFDSALSEFDLEIEKVAESSGNVDTKLAVLEDLIGHSGNMTKSAIFLNRTDEGCSGKNMTRRCYEYCKKVDYSSARLGAERQNLLALKAIVVDLSLQGGRAAAIVSKGSRNDAYLSTRGREYETFRMAMANDIRKLNASNSELQEKMNDTSIAPKIAELENLSNQINALADEELYRKAMAKKPEFENMSREIKNRINDELGQYGALASKMGLFSEKVQNATWILGNATAGQYLADVGRIKNSLGMPTTLANVKNATAEMKALEEKLASDMIDKAAKPAAAQQQIPQKLPCLPAFAVLFVAAFACGRKRKEGN